MAETECWKWLSKARNNLPGLQMNRIETGETVVGFPDVEGILQDHGQFLIELKDCLRPARPTSKLINLHIKQKQVEFVTQRAELGGNAWFLIRVHGRGRVKFYLFSGFSVEFMDTINASLIPLTEFRLQQFAVPIDFTKPELLIKFVCSNKNMIRYSMKFMF